MRLRPSATADLAWMFGSGPESYEGDCGLRSSMGSQIELLQSCVNDAGDRLPMPARVVDASAVEDSVIDRLGAAHRAAQIEERLRQLEPFTVQVLKVHFSGGSLPYCDVAAVLAPSARRLLLSRFREQAREGIALLREARRRHAAIGYTLKGWEVGKILEAVRLARKVLAEARRLSHLWQTRPIPTDVLRHTLLGASAEERHVIKVEADAMVTEAIRAYEEDTHVTYRRPVQVHEPRRGRWLH